MDTFNGLFSSFGGFLMSILPQSPFAAFFASWQPPDYIGWLNWIFPVADCVTLFEAWLSGVLVYAVYSVLMRWIKVIG